MNQYQKPGDNRQERKDRYINKRKEKLIKTAGTDKRQKEQTLLWTRLDLVSHLSPLLNNAPKLTWRCLFFCLHLFLRSAPWKLADSTSGLPHATSPQWNLATGVPSREFQVNQKQNAYNLDGIHITIPNLSTLCYFKPQNMLLFYRI